MNEWMNEWMTGWMDGRMDGWIDDISLYIYTFSLYISLAKCWKYRSICGWVLNMSTKLITLENKKSAWAKAGDRGATFESGGGGGRGGLLVTQSGGGAEKHFFLSNSL